MFDIPFHINRFISLTEVKHPLKTSNKIIYWPLMAFVNLGIGTGIGIGTGTDTTNAIISTSTRSMGTKPSKVVI